MKLKIRDYVMKAMILEKQGPIERARLVEKDIAAPKPGNDEVCVRVSVCGVCRTDLHIVEGDLPLKKKITVPGHQIVGTVFSVGKNVKKFKKGDGVGVTWLNSTCQKCEFCKTGRENLCNNIRHTGWDVDGGYAEYVTVREDFVYPLPKNFDEAHAAPLFCAGIIGFRGFRLSGIKPGGALAIYGFGASAHIIAQLARHFRCKVFVFTRNGEDAEYIKKFGVSWVGKSGDEPPSRVDAAIITAPVGELVPYAMSILERGGRLAILNICQTPVPQLDYAKHLYYEKSITSVTNYTKIDVLDFLKLAAEIPIKTEVKKFKLGEANKALKELKDGKFRGSAVLSIR